MASSTEQGWNRTRYWAATIVLCALLVFSGVLVLRDPTSAEQISAELHVPTYLGVAVLPVGQLLAAAIILWRKLPTLRIFAYAFVLYTFVVELLLTLSAQDYALAAFSACKVLVWVLAFWWDRDRIARTASDDTSQNRE